MNQIGPREAFFEKHGGKDKNILIGGWVVFEDGAKMEQASYGAMYDPPTDRRERAKVIVRYWEERLRIAVERFDEHKSNLKFQAEEAVRWADANTPPPPPTEDDIIRLKAYQAKAQKVQQKLAEARKELEDATPEFQKERQRRAAEAIERNSAALAAVEAVKI